MHRGLCFVALALTSCGAILGLEEPDFVGSDGGTNVPSEGAAPDGDASIDATSDVNGSDGPPDPTKRLREITFEEGFAVGGLTGASFASSTTIKSPGLRGNFAAKVGGKTSYVRYTAPSPQQELFITFRWQAVTFNLPDKNAQPQVLRVFKADNQPILELIADPNERLYMKLGAAQTPPSTMALIGAGELRIGLHIKAGAQGVAEVYLTTLQSTGFGFPYGQLMGSIELPTGFEVGSGTSLGPTPYAEVIIDDVIIDTEKLVVY